MYKYGLYAITIFDQCNKLVTLSPIFISAILYSCIFLIFLFHFLLLSDLQDIIHFIFWQLSPTALVALQLHRKRQLLFLYVHILQYKVKCFTFIDLIECVFFRLQCLVCKFQISM